ncbi:MAG: multidrug effflux MFS transporter [Dermabacter sp.]|nr:multidrug effflux MFS transporter [Dermabacter sp.]
MPETPESPRPEPLTETAALRLSLGRPEKVGIAFILSIALLSMLGPFSIDMIFPGFEQIGRDFAADTAALQQITSAYLIAFAIMSLFHGPLSDALGRKRVMTAALIIYIAATVGAALSTSLGMLIVFRALQGASAGGATIISRVVIRDLYGGGRAQKLMSQVMMIFAIAPAVAPIVGGWILLLGPWRWIVWAMAVYALITLTVMLVMIPETLPPARRQPFRAGSIFASLGRVVRSPILWRLALALAFSGSTHFMFIGGAPVIVPKLLHLGEQDYWVLFVPIIIGMIAGSYLVGRLADVISRTALITAAFATSLTGAIITVVLTLIAPDLTPELGLWHIVVMSGPLVIGMGSALMMAPVQLEILDLFPHERGAATSAATFLNLLNAALISGLIVPLLDDSLLAIALGALALSGTGALLWVLHLWLTRREALR